MDYKTISAIASTSLSTCSRRAKRKDIEFDLDHKYLVSIYPKDFLCPILGYEMKPGRANKHKGPSKCSPTLDRINPRLGYIKGNVEWVSYLANKMMSDAEGRDLIRFAEWINKKYNKQ